MKCLLEMMAEFSLFLKENGTPLLEHCERNAFIHELVYLADIVNRMFEINLSSQDPEVTIMDVTEKSEAFLAKLSIWK
jgi:hypothetical protein